MALSPLSAGTAEQPALEPGSPPVIQIEHVHKVYDLGEVQVHALRGISINIQPGEFVAIMGASGSGKSTFMNIVGCLDRPTRGRYLLEGADVASLSKQELARIRNRKIGFVFQGFNLLARTTAMENAELPVIYAGVPREERHRRAMVALKRVGLEGREHHYPSQLSGGQQQRVAIARALVVQPALLLADEPTGNLDSANGQQIVALLRKLASQQHQTIIVVTHDPDVATHADRLVRLRDGLVEDDGPVVRQEKLAGTKSGIRSCLFKRA